MSSFFQQTAQAMINRHIDRFPLLKIEHIIDWQPILLHLQQRKTHHHREQGGRPAYPA
ncbi:MAG: IS5/IS1182 family transposase, partial [Cardiobacteriaceae bacterium]|nr:IS5/IS1182 family transposase [Cardiobacteriaceae bacterium]